MFLDEHDSLACCTDPAETADGRIVAATASAVSVSTERLRCLITMVITAPIERMVDTPFGVS